jgi:hypothetical protein
MAAVSVLLAASSSLAAVSSLLTRGDGGGGGDSLGFLFDSHRGRGTRGSGGIEEELQRHPVLSHSIVRSSLVEVQSGSAIAGLHTRRIMRV